MIERYKTLGGVLALDEFSVAELAELSGVRESTVRTILRREGAFVEQVGTQSTGRRGGQPLRWRLRPAAREQLRAQLRELEQLGVGPWLTDQHESDDAPRAGIIAAEDVLLRLASTEVEPAKRTELVKLAEAHLDAADVSMSASRDVQVGTARRPIDRDRRIVELLLTLEQAEQDIAARRNQTLQEARIEAERLTTEARSRAQALERDSQKRYSRATSEISAMEAEIVALTRQRDQLLKQIDTIPAERRAASVSSTESRPRHGSGSGPSRGRYGTLGVGHAAGRAVSAEAAIESVRWSSASKSESARTAHPAAWMGAYLRRAALLDALCAILGGLVAFGVRFGFNFHVSTVPAAYLDFTLALPLLWLGAVALAGGYDPRFIGVGLDEFRKVLYAAVSLIAAVAIASYATKVDVAHWSEVVVLPFVAALDLIARFLLRKQLHKRRRNGEFMRRTVAVGPAVPVADLVTQLHRDTYYGLSVVAACVPGAQPPDALAVAGVPVFGGLDSVPSAVSHFDADTVAVLASPEMDGTRLRELAWDLEETGTDLWVSSALLDVAGPRTTIHPVAGLPLLHVDHAELAGGKRVLKGILDRVAAATALILLAPLLILIAVTIRLSDHGPALFTQLRVGKDGRTFKIYKFRTMVVDAEKRKAQLLEANDLDGILFKLRTDPRITAVGAHLRRWSFDELPQLVNVLLGDMSLVGPRPALPAEVTEHGDRMRRKLAVKPGLTGLWQVNGRSDLSWDEAERLDIRYIENWSLALDLQILLKTISALFRRSGAY